MADEMIDVYDKHGNKTRRVLLKSEVHKKSLWHAGAHLWIYDPKSEVLLQHRHPSKLLYPNTWDISVAGHTAAGDGPIETLVREAEEELGLAVDPEALQFIGVTIAHPKMPEGWVHRAIDWTYIVKMDINLKDIKMQATEVDDIRWIPLDEFEQDINNPQKFKEYSPRTRYIYQLAITEIREQIKRDKK
jgi:isopentenyldiphosphate isomerase